MKIFITGASGFVGGAAVKHLLGQHEIFAMARSASSAEKIAALGAQPVRCALGEVKPEHLADCEVLIHAAALVDQWGDAGHFWQTNVEGTSQLLEAAKAAGVRRFIHIGTEAALFHGQHMHQVDESGPYAFDSPFLYAKTKAEAEKRVLAANSDQFIALSIRPRMVWGPGDTTILPVVIDMINSGQFMWIDGGRHLTSTTHIANLTHAITLALEKGSGGEAYFVTDDEDRPLREFLTRVLAAHNIIPPNKSLPGWLVRGLARTLEGAWGLFRVRTAPPLTRHAAALMSRECTLVIDKAKKDLEYAPILTFDAAISQLNEAGSA